MMRETVQGIGIGLAIAAVAVGAWFATHKAASPGAAPQDATPAPAVAKTPTEPIHPKVVQAYPAKVKQKVNLPSAMRNDPAIAVLNSSMVPPTLDGQTVTTTLNTETGQVNTMISANPSPWLAGESTGSIRLDYGMKNGGRKVGRLSATENLFQIKSVHLGAAGALYSDGTYFIGVGGEYRW